MVLPDCAGILEIKQLKLTDQQFPFSYSLYNQVQNKYASAAQAAMEEQSMELDEVLGYLRRVEDFTQGPMDAIRALADAFGDPTLPTPGQVAILEWLQDAYALWTADFPIEEPLASALRKLLPVAASQAITDATFLEPGAHPVHRLLDTIQSSAVGWQAELGRAGLALEQLVATTIAETSAWFQDGSGDLNLICEKMITKATKDQDRAQRMTQRLVESETGRLRTASARCKSAEMINQYLETHKATAEIGQFLRGPWFESAQLVVLKFGADSPELAQMAATTKDLLDSLHIDESETEDARQHLFETVTKIPKEVKRWLLSLQMDSGAASEAIGPIEVTHLSLLRQQPIKLVTIEPLQVEGLLADRTAEADLHRIESLEPGQWFAIDEDQGIAQRVQLVLKLEQEQQLLFANKAGIKAMQQSFEDFCTLLAKGKARPLRSGASFSICLANAAGIETQADAQALAEYPRPDPPEPLDQQPQTLETQTENEESRPIENPQWSESGSAQAEKEEAERIQQEREELARREQAEKEEAERIQQEREELARREQAEKEEAERIQQEREELARREQAEKEQAERIKQEREELARREQAEKEQAERIQQEREEQSRREQAEKEEAERIQQERAEQERAEQALLDDPAYNVEIRLAMGTWLGFHDGSMPMMAKLAVHDREQDSYIFVNREGIKMRSLNKRELIDLMENNHVEILEMRSSFRDKVTQVKKDQN